MSVGHENTSRVSAASGSWEGMACLCEVDPGEGELQLWAKDLGWNRMTMKRHCGFVSM